MASVGSQSSTSTSEPWKGQQPYLKQLYEGAAQLRAQGPYQYGPNRVAGFDPMSEQAFGMAQRQAGDMSLRAPSKDLTAATMRGDFLRPESNPFLGRYVQHAQRGYYDSVNALGSRMESSGRTGGSAHAGGAARAEENFASGMGDLYGGVYQFERGMQGQAQQHALALGEEDWRNVNATRAIGAQREELAQRQLDDVVGRWNQMQYGSAEKLSEFANMIGQPVMTQRSTSSGSQIGVISCWVAAEFFGWFTPEWFAIRDYILEDAPEDFRAFYLREGQDLARVIREDQAIREEWRPVFEALRDRALEA